MCHGTRLNTSVSLGSTTQYLSSWLQHLPPLGLYIAVAVIIGLSLQKKFATVTGEAIPNGPVGLPVLGSLPFLAKYPERTLHYWKKIYGGLYSIRLGNQLVIVVSDPEIAKDLMVTNGAIFSSRKNMFIKSHTIFHGRAITATQYNNERKHRRIAMTRLTQRAVDSYSSSLDNEAMALIKSLLDASSRGRIPVDPQLHSGRCSLNNMTNIVFGFRTDSIDHPLVKRAWALSLEFMNCTGPMSNFVDFIPILQKMPSSLQKRGRRLHTDLVETYGGLIKDVEMKMRLGEEVPDCLAKTMILHREEEGLDGLDMAFIATAFMIGGVFTTAAVLQWFIALMATNPDIQKKAHAELDQVIGQTRPPSIEDEEKLPYCHALIKEVERLRNPFWLGTPHASSEDFVYRSWFIPKDTVVVLNTWSMQHDPRRRKDPEIFNASCPAYSESANAPDPWTRDHWVFGAGRRICPGVLVAEREIWLTISRMLWAFEMAEVSAEPIDLTEYEGISGRAPVQFRVNLRPRHGNV
ncbi:hypothetical protein NLG97_g9955 [Lecanicillium saksenae]|uniref:Uncharacterized protein n=1 Tax=Lecanicillium saksenae TaxID=468837 RepID=A0ACC1QII4_9HYPO|nr:hypothetical protein NLG97_g9955 [Lecanicillium saksenae]